MTYRKHFGGQGPQDRRRVPDEAFKTLEDEQDGDEHAGYKDATRRRRAVGGHSKRTYHGE
jgi:hypothetical protein